jgi:hypothetical protein
MIHNVLPVIGASLNEYLRSEFQLTEDRVVVSGLTDLKGNIASQIDNKLVVSLIGIEEEGTLTNAFPGAPGINAPIHINLLAMFSANFPESNYTESLRFLSAIITFFQGARVFNHQNTPMLSTNIDKVTCEMMSLSFQEQNLVWGTLGAKYIPSVVYRFRTLSMSRGNILEEVPRILGGEQGPPLPARRPPLRPGLSGLLPKHKKRR